MRQRTVLALVVAHWVLGCVAEDSSRAPGLDCSNDDCSSNNTGTVSSGSGGDGNSGGSTSNTAGTAGEVTLSGQIVEVDEPNFSVTEGTVSSGNFTVVVPGADGKDLSATVSAEFALGGVKSTENLWVSAKPNASSNLLTGLIALDSTATNTTLVPVVRASALELVATVLALPVTLDSSQGQVVLRFVDRNGDPVSGIKVAVSGAENVAYDAGSSYTDDGFTGTGNRGLCFLLNVDAANTPSAKVVSLSGAVVDSFFVWVEAGAATALELLAITN